MTWRALMPISHGPRQTRTALSVKPSRDETKRNLPECGVLHSGRSYCQCASYGWSYSAAMRAFGSTFGDSATGST